jgi:hypothetical protein
MSPRVARHTAAPLARTAAASAQRLALRCAEDHKKDDNDDAKDHGCPPMCCEIRDKEEYTPHTQGFIAVY